MSCMPFEPSGSWYFVLLSFNSKHSDFRRWEVMSLATVHRQALPTSSRSHHRGRIWGKDDQHRRKTNQAADLGYGE